MPENTRDGGGGGVRRNYHATAINGKRESNVRVSSTLGICNSLELGCTKIPVVSTRRTGPTCNSESSALDLPPCPRLSRLSPVPLVHNTLPLYAAQVPHSCCTFKNASCSLSALLKSFLLKCLSQSICWLNLSRTCASPNTPHNTTHRTIGAQGRRGDENVVEKRVSGSDPTGVRPDRGNAVRFSSSSEWFVVGLTSEVGLVFGVVVNI